MALTPKQQRFVDEYIVDLNAAAAYGRAGYATRTPQQAAANAARLIANDNIQAAIQTALARRNERVEVRQDDVLREAMALAFSDIGQIMDFAGATLRLRVPSDIPERARRAIASIKVRRYLEGTGEEAREVEVTEFKLYDKNTALEKLFKHLGLYGDEPRLPAGAGTTINNTQVNVNVSPDALRAFAEDLVAAGLGDLPEDGGEQPLDPAAAAPAAAAVPAP